MRKKALPPPLAPLHSWYRQHARDLPWREKKTNPYHVLVSEFLLQQTQVKQAIPYYHRFLKRFPTLRALADAPLDSVLKAWEGCGYYARARNLHKTAKKIMDEYGGKIPRAREKLLELPGIGPYLAASISSIAFEKPHAVLDGNVIRVLSRVAAYSHAADSSKAKKQLQKTAQGWMDRAVQSSIPPSLHNQAMMELGALVCTPKHPKCETCPLAKGCRAHVLGREEDFPIKGRKQTRPLIQAATGLLFNEKGEILISQRYGDDFLGGLWEFPGGKQDAGESLAQCVEREFEEEVGLCVRALKKIMRVRAEYTHKSVDLSVFLVGLSPRCASVPRPLECQAVKWEKIQNLRRYAFPKANHALLDWLEKNADSA